MGGETRAKERRPRAHFGEGEILDLGTVSMENSLFLLNHGVVARLEYCWR